MPWRAPAITQPFCTTTTARSFWCEGSVFFKSTIDGFSQRVVVDLQRLGIGSDQGQDLLLGFDLDLLNVDWFESAAGVGRPLIRLQPLTVLNGLGADRAKQGTRPTPLAWWILVLIRPLRSRSSLRIRSGSIPAISTLLHKCLALKSVPALANVIRFRSGGSALQRRRRPQPMR